MSVLEKKTDVYQSLNKNVSRKHLDYGFVLAIICIALVLVAASINFTPAPVGSGISSEISFVGP